VTGAATRYTTFMASQVKTTGSAAAGDSSSITLTCQFLEN
jgi:hypothetical protein